MQPSVQWMLDQEARALLTRLNRVKPFILTEPMLPAASLLPPAQIAIERFLAKGRQELKKKVEEFQGWLKNGGAAATPEEAQKRFTFLRLRFNAVLTQLDLFGDVITQRSENENGVWLSGLDVVSADALAMPEYYRMPPVICYLDRGIGAAIRRARTRLPGGGENPVAIIRVPRERMVGSGIASSLVHEVGHQGSVLLELIPSLRPVLQEQGRKSGGAQEWILFDRWISEILADFWSVARVGVVSTLGLIGVVGLPRPFVFRLNLDDPHPMPWLRVKLSCAIGKALYPHPQWQGIAEMWESFYPLADLDAERRGVIAAVEAALPQFIELLVEHRPKSLRGKTLREAMQTEARQPARLAALFKEWVQEPAKMYREAPALAFAVLGQAKMDKMLSPEDEADLLAKLLNYWAMRSTLDMSGVLHELTYDAGTSVY
uniref:hypothetical protein n=1 Tax=Candidatus Electronema sp. TaxID=2698783 RepID=UPI0040560A4B